MTPNEATTGPMKVLFVSNLFPEAANPVWGGVNSRLLHRLATHCDLRVVAARPSLPLVSALKAPRRPCEADAKFQPCYPPVYYVPVVGSRVNHRLYGWSLAPLLKRIRTEFPYEVILVSWIYPDACGIAEIAARLGVPFVAIAQGSDVHEYLLMPTRRRIITRSMQQAAAVITRSAELSRMLAEAGVASERLFTIRNGVDTDVFSPAPQIAARQRLGLPREGSILLYVGNFLNIKNPLLLVRAHAELSRQQVAPCHLVMIGTGPLQAEARALADKLGFGPRLMLQGSQPPAQVAEHMRAADLLCVPSHNEGLPNVILEAFACGLRVVATRVGGIPEVVTNESLGRLVEPGNAAAMAAAAAELLATPPATEAISRHASRFAWQKTAAAYALLLRRVCQRAPEPGDAAVGLNVGTEYQ